MDLLSTQSTKQPTSLAQLWPQYVGCYGRILSFEKFAACPLQNENKKWTTSTTFATSFTAVIQIFFGLID